MFYYYLTVVERKNKMQKTEYSYWDDAARAAVQYIDGRDHPSRMGTIAKLRAIEDLLIDDFFSAEEAALETEQERVKNLWAAMGAEAFLLAKKQKIELSVDEVSKILVRKQRDYGPENIKRFGRRGLIVRMHDKIARLENLTAKNAVPNNESIADNILDVIGYAAIGIMWEQGQFLTPLKPYALTTS